MDRSSSRWDMLTRPFAEDEVELLPKYTGRRVKGQPIPREAYRECPECGGYHPFPCVHLKYVGHANVTMRLNEVDSCWNWEPVAVDSNGLPLVMDGSLWIRLTVLGVTRLGVGDAQNKTGPDAMKEIVGDAIRNAAMRFGVGTYLWSKSERAGRMADSQPVEEPIDCYRDALEKARNAGLSIKACMATVKDEVDKPPEQFDFQDIVQACVIVERLVTEAKATLEPESAPNAAMSPEDGPDSLGEPREVVIEF